MYILDSNIFIQAYRGYYAFDIAPKFWDELNNHSGTGNIVSIDHVQKELLANKDPLVTWIKSNCTCSFEVSIDEATLAAYGDVMQWVNNARVNNELRFTDSAKSEFASVADGWIVAYAKAHDCIVTTLELPNANCRSRVKIPDVCNAFSVPFVNTFAMLRQLRISFT